MPEIRHQLIIKAPRKAVFEAFATPEGLNSWWTLESSGEPTIHTTYRLFFGPKFDWIAKVVHVRTGHELKWALERAMDDWMPTVFGFSLAEIEGGTCVRFAHTGWESQTDHFEITSYCWAQLLNGLKNYVERGVVIPFEERE